MSHHSLTLEAMSKRLAEWEEKTDDSFSKPEPIAMYDSDMAIYLNDMTGQKAEELQRNIDRNKK